MLYDRRERFVHPSEIALRQRLQELERENRALRHAYDARIRQRESSPAGIILSTGTLVVLVVGIVFLALAG